MKKRKIAVALWENHVLTDDKAKTKITVLSFAGKVRMDCYKGIEEQDIRDTSERVNNCSLLQWGHTQRFCHNRTNFFIF